MAVKKVKSFKKKHSANRRVNKKGNTETSDNNDDFATVSESVMDTMQAASDSQDGDDEAGQIRKLVSEQNRKNKKSGGFQAMGLSNAVFRGIFRKGYKMPTPIQRKCVPLILEGHDVVAMARTGSGKTAAFLIPLFERLKARSSSGARALLLSPTRELAMQTLQFTKELGKYMDLKTALILGGEKMENQFAAFHGSPDIIIATPGRLLHVLVEMGTKLSSVEYVVFDEADRLFEQGFEEQLREILCRLAPNRQTLLFSATLPKQLVEFAKAGLSDAQLVRLDVESKLSENLTMLFLSCRSDDKPAVLLHLLQHVVPAGESTVVFAATKHHVDYLSQLLTVAGIDCVVAYSDLDAVARKINVAKFRNKKVHIMIVTDIAARGIDIPILDNVINYHFPPKSKLFIHRVGRVARAGKSGKAYSLVANDELACLVDLHLFLSQPMKLSGQEGVSGSESGVIGGVPHAAIELEQQAVYSYLASNHELASQQKVADNAYKQYIKCRPTASVESDKRVKGMRGIIEPGIHPIFTKYVSSNASLLDGIRKYKPASTVFEMHSTAKTEALHVMKKKRQKDEGKIEWHKKKCDERRESGLYAGKSLFVERAETAGVRETERQETSDYFIPYQPRDAYTERGLAVESNRRQFETDMNNASLDLTNDDVKALRSGGQQRPLMWDRKRKKFTGGNDIKGKKIKTESGKWIPATYQSNQYNKWLKRHRTDDTEGDVDEVRGPAGRRRSGAGKQAGKPGKGSELKSTEQIYKQRKTKQRVKSFQKMRQRVKMNKRGGGKK